MTNKDWVNSTVAAATMAVLRGARSVREVCAMCGWTSPDTAQRAIRAAVLEGLLVQPEGTKGGLHAAVVVVATESKPLR